MAAVAVGKGTTIYWRNHIRSPLPIAIAGQGGYDRFEPPLATTNILIVASTSPYR